MTSYSPWLAKSCPRPLTLAWAGLRNTGQGGAAFSIFFPFFLKKDENELTTLKNEHKTFKTVMIVDKKSWERARGQGGRTRGLSP